LQEDIGACFGDVTGHVKLVVGLGESSLRGLVVGFAGLEAEKRDTCV
jgi:hypothetical protein